MQYIYQFAESGDLLGHVVTAREVVAPVGVTLVIKDERLPDGYNFLEGSYIKAVMYDEEGTRTACVEKAPIAV